MCSKKQEKQRKLWTLLGQVTAAQRWNIRMLQALSQEGFHIKHLEIAHETFVAELRYLERLIRQTMKAESHEQGTSSNI